MNLLIARATLFSTPSKYLFEVTAYESVVMLLLALILTFVL